MSAPHTPGPWTVREDGDANHYTLIGPDGRWLVSLLHNGEALTERQRANLLLMAAAPDLLEAVEGLMSTMDYMREQRPDLFGEGEGRWLSPQMSEGYRKGRAAIAKAKGSEA
jgi:hypothetical protein